MQVQAISSLSNGGLTAGGSVAAGPLGSVPRSGRVWPGSLIDRLDQLWPPTVIGVGLGLNAAWVVFLGYGFVSLIFR